ncbi:hypothetical protein G6F69_005979 [Rhizopus microsporus]|nr:hypothetical protein G6F69_005979 [Rhizopus microsporus]
MGNNNNQTASRRRRRAEDQQEAGVATRPRGRPRAKPAVYISQLSRLRPLVLGRCDTVSAKDRANNNNKNRFEGSEPYYVQLYIFDPSCAAERRQARNSNLDPETIRELSAMLAQCKPFVRVYRHAHEVLSNHESSNTVSDGNNQREDSTPCIIISPSMRMRLIEGSDRRTHNLPAMEEIVAVIPIEYSDRSVCDIVLTLRGNNKNIRTTLKAVKEDTSVPGPSNVVINEKTSMPAVNKDTSVQAVLSAPTPSTNCTPCSYQDVQEISGQG